MRKLSLICAFLTIAVISYCQDEYETIGSGTGKVKVSGFIGPIMEFTKIDGQFAHMMGGGGGVIINNFFFGGYGMGKTTEMTYRGESSNNMTFGHGGFWLGYTFKHNKAIHPVIHTQIGWGRIGKTPKDEDIELEEEFGDRVFVIVPTFELEMNFSRFFKLGAGVNYQFVYNTGEQYSPYTSSDFASPGVFLSLKFGWFK